MDPIRVFDARITVGKSGFGDKPLSLAEAMAEAQAERAVFVCNEFARFTPQYTNGLAELRAASVPGAWGLYQMYSALAGEQAPVEELVRGFRKKRIAGFYLHQKEAGTPFDPLMFRDELAACEARHIPVFYHKDAGNSFEYLCAVLEKHPALTVVLSIDEEWPNARKLYPVMKAYEGVHLCLSEHVWMGAVDDVARLFGAKRMLYSSSWPKRYPGGTVMMVQTAQIPREDKDLIFRGNMERLIGGIVCD